LRRIRFDQSRWPSPLAFHWTDSASYYWTGTTLFICSCHCTRCYSLHIMRIFLWYTSETSIWFRHTGQLCSIPVSKTVWYRGFVVPVWRET
jgi:hypothetical protein